MLGVDPEFGASLVRLWIAAGLAAIALGGVKGLTNMLPASRATPMAMAWLPQMPGMAAGLAPWALLTSPPCLRSAC